MPLLVKNIEVVVNDPDHDKLLRVTVAKKLGIEPDEITLLEIKKKSIDARKKSQIKFIYQLYIKTPLESKILSKNLSDVTESNLREHINPLEEIEINLKKFSNKPVIIGSGPSGIFCALILAYAGQPSIIVERGEPVEKRQKTANKIRRSSEFNPESNYCFGEGGAGTFSDGKLTCGRNHPLIEFLFQEWVKFGAPEDILYDAHPHIGTDFLMIICIRMRKYLESQGCQFLFNTRFTGFEKNNSTYKVILNDKQELETEHLILALGHSARDTYQMLFDNNLSISQKPFAVGTRFEHPQDLINKIQFGQSSCYLPSAEYKLAAKANDRGIWTFCMCPGGFLMPTNAQANHLAINGMSYYKRDSGFANAAVVVNVKREDFDRGHPLDGVRFQEKLEQAAFKEGGENYFAPAQRLTDFLHDRLSKGKMETTYKPGLTPARMDRILPQFITDALKVALTDYNNKMHGYISDQGIIAGIESKTSAPILMNRDKNSYESASHAGLYPIGEGAGFAGGIVSAALDGVKAGLAILKS